MALLWPARTDLSAAHDFIQHVQAMREQKTPSCSLAAVAYKHRRRTTQTSLSPKVGPVSSRGTMSAKLVAASDHSADANLFPTANDVEKYLEAYAQKFDLKRHVQFSKKVTRIERDEAIDKWAVYTRSTRADGVKAKEQRQVFDRIVTATGILTVPVKVDIKGIEGFEGEVVHSRDFKDPYRYAEKNVLVVGIGASGADTQSFLKRAKARSVTVSHRGQYYLVNSRPFTSCDRNLGLTYHLVP